MIVVVVLGGCGMGTCTYKPVVQDSSNWKQLQHVQSSTVSSRVQAHPARRDDYVNTSM